MLCACPVECLKVWYQSVWPAGSYRRQHNLKSDTKGEVMKTLIMFFLILLAIFSPCECKGAAVYSFEGVVSSLYDDGAGIIADEGFRVGDPVSARFYVDFQREGYYLLNNGEILVPENPQMTNNPFWWFFATLLDGTLLPEKNGGSNNRPTDIAEYREGYLNSNPMGNTGALTGGSGDSHLTVKKAGYTDVQVQNWVVGENLKGILVGYGDQQVSVMWAEMRLVGIQSVPSVPSAPSVTGETTTHDTTPTWHWTSCGGGNGVYRYRLADGNWSTTMFKSFTPRRALPEGRYTVYVQESDEGGNWSLSGEKSIVIDLTPPTAPAVVGITPTRDTTPTWSWTSSGGGNGVYRYRLARGTWKRTRSEAFTPRRALSEGRHTLYVQEADEAGNWSVAGRKSIVIERQ